MILKEKASMREKGCCGIKINGITYSQHKSWTCHKRKYYELSITLLKLLNKINKYIILLEQSWNLLEI